MVEHLHSLLKRQLRKHGYGDGNIPSELTSLLEAVSDAYYAFDNDRTLVEHSLELSSQELFESNKEIKKMFADLTSAHQDLKSTQQKLLQSEKMASIGQLAAGIAHEINNPLSFINSNNDILTQYVESYNAVLAAYDQLRKFVALKDMSGASTAMIAVDALKTEKSMEQIKSDILQLLRESKDGIERIKNIVLDLKVFSRADKDDVAPMDINKTIEDILNIVNNEIKYHVEIIKDLGNIPQIRGNEKRLGQVFMNLFINAAQAIEDTGRITIKTALINKNVIIQVSDTGMGIKKEELSKIFDPFYTTKPVGKGTGLGLSICYDIIKGHGGEIRVLSEVNKGTTFIVSLPVN